MVPKEEFKSPMIWSQKRNVVVPKEEFKSPLIWFQKRSLEVFGYGPKRGI